MARIGLLIATMKRAGRIRARPRFDPCRAAYNVSDLFRYSSIFSRKPIVVSQF